MRREEKEKREIKRLFLSSLSTFVSPIKKKLVFMWLVSTKFRLSVVSSVFFCCSFSTHRTFMSHVTCQSTTEFFHLRTFAKNTFFSFSQNTHFFLCFFHFLHFFLSELFVLVSISPLKQHPFPVLSIHQRTR